MFIDSLQRAATWGRPYRAHTIHKPCKSICLHGKWGERPRESVTVIPGKPVKPDCPKAQTFPPEPETGFSLCRFRRNGTFFTESEAILLTLSEQKLFALTSQITPPDGAAMQRARLRQAELAKPPGSLGLLEELSVQLAGITGQVHNEVGKTRLYVFAADNGVTAEGVASAPQSVTMAQSVNLTRGLTGAGCLCKHFGDELIVVDMGIHDPYFCPAIVNRSLGKGTKNLAVEPAMTREQAVEAILTGFSFAVEAKKDGVSLVGAGEMGIGNTTTSSAVLSCLTGLPVSVVTGRGGGITDAAFVHKKEVIERALSLHQPNPADPIDVLSKVGGFDICAMAGFYLGCAHERLPVVIDGFIAIVAALCAARLCRSSVGYFIASHESFEPGYRKAAQELGLRPFLDMGMRLGEGSGCPLAFRMVEAACAVMNTMATFPEAAINDDYLTEIRAKDSFTV